MRLTTSGGSSLLNDVLWGLVDDLELVKFLLHEFVRILNTFFDFLLSSTWRALEFLIGVVEVGVIEVFRVPTSSS